MGQHIETYRKMIEKDPAFSEVSRQMASSCGSSFPEQMTCFLLAPVAVSFAAWVLREAVGRKIDRVYFLARDGWQFYHAARALQKSWKLPVELRYLYCSRYSLRIPCYCLMGEEALGYICLRGMEVSFADMMARAGLDEGEAGSDRRKDRLSGRYPQAHSSDTDSEIPGTAFAVSSVSGEDAECFPGSLSQCHGLF